MQAIFMKNDDENCYSADGTPDFSTFCVLGRNNEFVIKFPTSDSFEILKKIKADQLHPMVDQLLYTKLSRYPKVNESSFQLHKRKLACPSTKINFLRF